MLGRTTLIVNRLFVLFRIYLYVYEKTGAPIRLNRCTSLDWQVHPFRRM